jgi:hypothetical protein
MGQEGRVALEMFVRGKPLITIRTMEGDACPFGSASDGVELFEDLRRIAAQSGQNARELVLPGRFSNQECTDLGQFRSEGLIE